MSATAAPLAIDPVIRAAFRRAHRTRHEIPLVTALGVFVVRRQSFDAVVRTSAEAREVKNILFRELPLGEHGWNEDTAKLILLGASKDGFPIWRINRS